VLAFLLVSQMIVGTAPTAEQSAQILANLESPSNFTKRFICTDCNGPRVAIVYSRAEDGPFGPFPYYPFTPVGWGSYYGYSGYGYYGGWSGVYISTPLVSRGGLWRSSISRGSVFNASTGSSVRAVGSGGLRAGPYSTSRSR